MKATFGKLTVVDLAGSERIKKSGASGAQFREATSINGSLLLWQRRPGAGGEESSSYRARSSRAFSRIRSGVSARRACWCVARLP